MKAVALGALALIAMPAAAHADATITALPRDRYDAAEYTIDAGEKVTFVNRDIATHDVVGEGFRSALTDPGESNPVAGAEKLTAGRYPFVCSLHSYMKGTLVVRGGSAPPPEQPPPGDPPPQEGPAPDTTAPRVIVRIRGRVARVTVDEAATVRLGRRTRRTSGPQTVRFRIPAGARRIVVTATDASGNRRRVVRRVRRR